MHSIWPLPTCMWFARNDHNNQFLSTLPRPLLGRYMQPATLAAPQHVHMILQMKQQSSTPLQPIDLDAINRMLHDSQPIIDQLLARLLALPSTPSVKTLPDTDFQTPPRIPLMKAQQPSDFEAMELHQMHGL